MWIDVAGRPACMERNLKYPLLVLRRDADFQFYCPFAHCFLVPPLRKYNQSVLIFNIVPQIRFSKNGRTQDAKSCVRHIFVFPLRLVVVSYFVTTTNRNIFQLFVTVTASIQSGHLLYETQMRQRTW